MADHQHLPSSYFDLRALLPARSRVFLLLNRVGDVNPALSSALTAWIQRRRTWSAAPHSVEPWILDALLEDVDSSQRSGRRVQARKELWLLENLPNHEARLQRIAGARSHFASLAVVALLLARSRERVHAEPRQARELAELAGMVAERVARSDTTSASSPRLAATGLAVAYQGNAYRAAGELRRAAECFLAGRQRLSQDAPPWILGEILHLHGSLLKDLRQTEEAHTTLEGAGRFFLAAGDKIAAAKVQLNLAANARHGGDLERAIRFTVEALESFDPLAEPHLYLWSHHNLALYLLEEGQVDTAAGLLTLLHPLYEQFESDKPAVRRRWLEALLAQARGQVEAAEQAFTEVIEAFTSQGAALYAALAALDLALMLFDRKRHGELALLAARLRSIFEAERVHPEARAAALLFEKAAVNERVSRQLVTALKDYFDRARSDPGTRFQNPG